MGADTSKVRLYDLAKELKIDTKRLIEEVRREGVDVSVPSNSVSKELAEKIRDKYFPKKDAAVKRAVKVVKKAARTVVEEVPLVEEEEVVAQVEVAEPETAPAAPETPPPVVPSRVVRRLSPAIRAEKPAAPSPVAAPQEITQTQTPSTHSPAEPRSSAPARVESAPSRQVRVMRPTAAAINAGIRPGERAPAPPPSAAPTRERVRERTPRARVGYAGA